MTATENSAPPRKGGLRQNLLIGAASVVIGAVVIPYGASMPYIREGIPGPGLFPMMIGGLLVLFGVLLVLTTWLSERRETRHRAELAAAGASVAGARVHTADGPDLEAEAFALPGASVPESEDDVPVEELEAAAVLDTDVGSDGARRWINGAILMGGIVAYVLLAPVLGFPITMALLVTTIVKSLRASWLTAVLTGVLTALGLWVMFEQVLLVQLPDGLIRGF